MERISTINNKVKKTKTFDKKVPRSESTQFQQKIDTLLPNDLHNLEDPSTYLTAKRNSAKADVNSLSSLLFSPMHQRIRSLVLSALSKDPSYNPLLSCELPPSEHRAYTNDTFVKVMKAIKLSPEEMRRRPDFFLFTMSLFSILHASAATKLGVQYGLYSKTLLRLGSEKHQKAADRGLGIKDFGCFCLTELGHGSNVQGILTTATYNHKDRKFILNTTHELGRKWWIGNLARSGSFAVVFAKLIINEKDEGVHVFHVRIRDERGNLMPGVTVGDLGKKLGHNGVDNGWASFRRVELDYDCLLDRYSEIDNNGVFKSPISKKMERFAVMLGALSGGRLAVGYTSGSVLMDAGLIAVRYLSVRKQFGAKKYQEGVLIDYPLVQNRLFPLICGALIRNQFIESIFYEWEMNGMSKEIREGNFPPLVNNKQDKKREKELHALSSYLKVANSWDANKGLLTIRELCGGHGFSSYSKLPDLIEDQNVQVTWEGTNDVLIQQTAKFLAKIFAKYATKGQINYASFAFLKGFEDDNMVERELKAIVGSVANMNGKDFNSHLFLRCIKRLLQYRLKVVGEFVAQRFQISMEDKKEAFGAFNRTLPDSLIDACLFYGEYKSFEFFEGFLQKKEDSDNKKFLERVLVIYGIEQLREKGHYLSEVLSVEFYKALNDILLEVNKSVVSDMVVLGDVLLLPDEFNLTTIGKSDGDVYRNIISKIYGRSEHFGKDESWKDTLGYRGHK